MEREKGKGKCADGSSDGTKFIHHSKLADLGHN